MFRRLVLLLAGLATLSTATSMRRVVSILSGPPAAAYGRVLCCDSDHDSLPEVIFSTGGTVHPPDPLRLEVWEHQGWNRFSLVFADTGEYPEPPGITIGNAIPFAAGDIDNDGLTDVVCITVEPDSSNPDTVYDDVITIESPDSFSYPFRLSWRYRYANNEVIPYPTYLPPDLDGDGHREIQMGGEMWENVSNDSNALAWTSGGRCGPNIAYGDFDQDGKMNFATGYATMYVWECTGDDQYQVVYQDDVGQSNGYDVFTTNDIDGDGPPEFYVAYENVPRGKMYLYMWEADEIGSEVYHRTLIDSVSISGTDWGRISESGDIDGDGIDECIWTTPDIIKVYKAVGNDNLQEVWHWDNDHGGFRSLASTVYDINNDGYNELITAGNNKTSVFEVDAVDLLSPNGGSCSVGDTVNIRWAVNTPPRCDSLSLFLRRDSLWDTTTIATGLPGTDTLYHWVVPASVPESGWIGVMAYGPGHQFIISDSVITFIGGGVAEGTRKMPLQWSLSVGPNPARGAFTVRYDVPGLGAKAGTVPRSARTRGTVPVFALGVYDAGGRLVRSLSEGDVVPGRYEARLPSGALSAGVYFCTLDNGTRRISRKIVLTE